MRSRVVLIIGAVIAVGVAGLVLWPAEHVDPGPPDQSTAPAPAEFKTVEVRATGSQQGYALRGVVRDSSGAPIAGADVFLAATAQPTFTSLRCGVCSELLLSCHAHETARSVASLFEGHRGELQPALSTRSDAQGAFVFENLSGISFTLWGRAPGFGEGIKERAAPGDPAELFLPLPRSISGRLKTELGQPVAGGKVRISSRRIARVFEITSDEQGQFTLDGLGEGPFVVSATASNLLPALDRQVDGDVGTLVELTLQSPRSLEVRVVKDGQPTDAILTLEGDHLSRRLDVKGGLVTVSDLPPGDVMAVASAGSLSSAPMQVSLASLSNSVTLTLDQGGSVAVTVLDEASQPVPHPTVEIFTRGGRRLLKREGQTGELISFGPLGAGEYQVTAHAQGFQAATMPVVVKAGETAVEMTLTSGTVISGRVIDEYGRPAPGVSVLITPTSDSVVADAEGRFSAAVPSPGLYELHAHHSDWGGIDLKVKAPKEGVELQLEPRGGAQITVSANGRRLEGASVTLFHAQGNFRSDRTSGADGVVLMRGLPPGSYQLVASHSDFLPSERQPVVLRDGDLLKLNAELKAGGAITGRVVDQTGSPVQGVRVSAAPRVTEPQVTDAQGHFKLSPVRPGLSVHLRATLRGFEQVGRVVAKAGDDVQLSLQRLSVFTGRVLGDGQPLKNFRVDEHEVTSTDGRFELPLPATVDRVIVSIEAAGFEPLMADRPNSPDLGEFDLKRAPLVTGIVRDETGQGVADAVVSCESCEQSVVTDQGGKFTIGKPAFQREFTLTAKKGRRSASRRVSSSALQGVELTLRPGVKVSGVAYLGNGTPASGVEVAGLNDRNDSVSAVTNEDGSYVLEVAPGSYRFWVGLNGPGAESEDPPAIITTIEGDTRLDFGAVPGRASLTVRVTPRSGYALWLVRGELSAVGNPPMELLRAPWAELIYQPHTERVTLGGLSPGRYTLVWTSFHAAVEGGAILVPVQVPASGEVTLVR